MLIKKYLLVTAKEQYFDDFEKRSESKYGKSLKTTKNILNPLINYLISNNIIYAQDVVYKDVLDYLNVYCETGKKKEKGTIRNVKGKIITFFNWMKQKGIIDKNPICLLKRGKRPKRISKDYSKEEIAALIETIRTQIPKQKEKITPTHRRVYRDIAILQSTLEFSIRIEECLDIVFEGISYLDNNIRMRRSKGNDIEYVYGNPEFFELISSVAELWDIQPGEYLFLSEINKRTKYSQGSFDGMFRKYQKKTTVDLGNGVVLPLYKRGRGIHGMRRTGGEVLRESGCTPEEIATGLSQSDTSQLSSYTNPHKLDEKVAAVEGNLAILDCFDLDVFKKLIEEEKEWELEITSLADTDFEKIYECYRAGKIGYKDAYKKLGVNPSTFLRRMKKYEIELGIYTNKKKKIERPENFIEIYNKRQSKEISYKEALKKLGISSTAYTRLSKEYEDELRGIQPKTLRTERPEDFIKIYNQQQSKEISDKEAFQILNISRYVYQRLLKEYREELLAQDSNKPSD